MLTSIIYSMSRQPPRARAHYSNDVIAIKPRNHRLKCTLWWYMNLFRNVCRIAFYGNTNCNDAVNYSS